MNCIIHELYINKAVISNLFYAHYTTIYCTFIIY